MNQQRISQFPKQMQEGLRVKDSPSPSTEAQANAIKYCDRCARRSPALVFDDLTLQELCQDCCNRLNRKRGMASRPGKPKV
jgi:hypothetical protein